MSTISAGLVNATNLTVTGTQSGAVQATNFNTQNVNTGNVNATGVIAAGGPMHDGVIGFTPSQHAAIQSHLNTIADGVQVPNSFVAYGNASSTEIYTKVAGKQSNGSAVPADPYFRLASCSKVIGAVAAAKLIADRWVNLDTPIAAYLGNYDASSNPNGDKIFDYSGNLLVAPWKSANRTIIDVSGNVKTMQQAWNEWGAQQVPSPITGACPDITVGHCLNHTCGLSYDYYTFARYTGLYEYVKSNTTLQRVSKYGISDTTTSYARGQTGFSEPGATMAPPRHLIDDSGNPLYTVENYLTLISTQPLSSLPGVFCEYGRGMDIMGLMFDQLIKQNLSAFQSYYGNTNIVDCVTFIQQTILIPIGINDSWMYGGQSQPPPDAKARMLSASHCRNAISAVGAKCPPYGIVDTSQNGLVSISGVPVAKYQYTDLSGFTFTGYFDVSNNPLTVFCDATPNDTNSEHMNEFMFANFNPNLVHRGQQATGWNMSASSFAKFLRLYENDGYDVVSKTRIMPKSAFKFIKQCSVSNTQFCGLGDYDEFKKFENAPLQYSFALGQPLLWSYGCFQVMDPGVMAYKTGYANGFNLPLNTYGLYPMTSGSHFWSGLYNSTWYVDNETGNYVIYGTSQPTWATLNANFYNLAYSNLAVPTKAAPSPSARSYAVTKLLTILDGSLR